ncbi:flagellar protein export ATPase FliI [Bacteroidetes/Chlorobi group bacterium MS-B_bin-24]|jgi:flagellum-specific ATP synthase|nr:MAG: flagellar protein export ATPase FliI [Bacteroidetes/Chlorobi group bacterium MS-B_bin-24]
MFEISKIKDKIIEEIPKIDTLVNTGRVTKVIGLVLESEGPKAKIGEICHLVNKNGKVISTSEIVGFRNNQILSMVLGDLIEIEPGTKIVATGETLKIKVGDALLGRVLDGLGNPIDGKGEIQSSKKRSVYASPPSPLQRQRITTPVATGIKAIDGLLTLGKGQRIGIFSGSGVGKSTLLGMIARKTSADINVIALIGERGREVREFLEKDLGEEGLNRSVVVVATSDAPSLVRVKAALVATTIAEYFRDQGLDVMLMMDSSTRLAMAQREIGLTIGEPPTTKGYTPSVFALLQKVMERAGTSVKGSITGLCTVLVEGDDLNEPVADTARGILDGHIVLSRKLASMGHYPAIDVLESISRVMNDIISKEHKQAVSIAIENLATYRNAEDLISVGAYQKGTNPKIDRAISMHEVLTSFLRQDIDETHSFEETVKRLIEITSRS